MRGLQLTSEVTSQGDVVLRLVETPVSRPESGQILVRVEAAPVNPSDIGLALAGADPSQFRRSDADGAMAAMAPVDRPTRELLAARLDRPLPVGNEGAGIVIDAGASVRHLLGKTVAVLGGGMFAQYRTIDASACMAFPDGVTPAQAASAFVNPLTALGMVHTMRTQGHQGLIHTAAASSLGQILNRICADEGVPLVNIVRSQAQAEILAALGADWIVNSSAPDFVEQLVRSIRATRATIAFDAIGGGAMAGRILSAMEAVFGAELPQFSRYGSDVHKQVYIYGGLDRSPTVLDRSWGMSWGVGGWLLTPFLQRICPDERSRLQQRIIDGIGTIFGSRHSAIFPLSALVDPRTLARIGRPATGEKYLIDPQRADSPEQS